MWLPLAALFLLPGSAPAAVLDFTEAFNAAGGGANAVFGGGGAPGPNGTAFTANNLNNAGWTGLLTGDGTTGGYGNDASETQMNAGGGILNMFVGDSTTNSLPNAVLLRTIGNGEDMSAHIEGRAQFTAGGDNRLRWRFTDTGGNSFQASMFLNGATTALLILERQLNGPFATIQANVDLDAQWGSTMAALDEVGIDWDVVFNDTTGQFAFSGTTTLFSGGTNTVKGTPYVQGLVSTTDYVGNAPSRTIDILFEKQQGFSFANISEMSVSSPSAVPEPNSLRIALLGLLGVALVARRRLRAQCKRLV